jgi:hypothetical protein
MLWGSGRIKDDGLCRIHLKTQRKPGEDIERARRKLIQAAPYAVDILEDLMENAESEPVRLKASTEILDRAGIRGGQDINIDMEVTEVRPAAQVVLERLARLQEGAQNIAARIASLEAEEIVSNSEILEAEIVEEVEDGVPEDGLPDGETKKVIIKLTDEPTGDPSEYEFDDDLETEARE